MKSPLPILIFFCSIFLTSSMFAQVPEGNPNCDTGDGIVVTTEDDEEFYLGGYGADIPLVRIPYLGKIDTLGQIQWKTAFQRDLIGSVVDMIDKEDYLYVLCKFDSVALPTSHNIYELSKIDKNTGLIDWSEDVFSDLTYESGYLYFHSIERMTFTDDNSLTLMINRRGGDEIVNHILTHSIDSGESIDSYVSQNEHIFVDFTYDENLNLYGIGMDTIYALDQSNFDVPLWKTPIENTVWNPYPGRIFIKENKVYAITTNPEGHGQVIKLDKITGEIEWNTLEESQYGQVGGYAYDDESLFVTWNPTTTGGGAYFLKAEKINLQTGSITWDTTYYLADSSGGGYSYALNLDDSSLLISGFGREHIYYEYREDYWFTYSLNINNGEEIFYKKNLLDPERNEEYSLGINTHRVNDKIYSLGNFQALNQMTNPSSYVEYPMTNIGLVALDLSGEELFRELIHFGTEPIVPTVLDESVICPGDTLFLSSDNSEDWLFEWSLEDVVFSIETDTFLVMEATSNIDLMVDNGTCIYEEEWDVFISETEGIDSYEQCSPLLWIDGNEYPESNYNATHTLTNIYGCDSIVTLDLTIQPSYFTTDEISACESYTWLDGITYIQNESFASITYLNEFGCDSIVTLNLTIDNIDNEITQLENELSVSESADEYQWVICPEMTPIDGAIESTYIATMNGDFAVEITQGSCEETSDCVTVSGVSVFENNPFSELKVSPNPSSGLFIIELGTHVNELSYEVRDIMGKVIAKNQLTSIQSFSMNLDAAPGVYFVMITSKERLSTIRLVIE